MGWLLGGVGVQGTQDDRVLFVLPLLERFCSYSSGVLRQWERWHSTLGIAGVELVGVVTFRAIGRSLHAGY